MDEWVDGWMNEWMDECMDEWMDGWKVGGWGTVFHWVSVPQLTAVLAQLRFFVTYLQITYYYPLTAIVNQHPPAHHEGWMVSGEETVFCWVPVLQ